MRNTKKIVPLNTYGDMTHKMTRGKNIYNNDLYKKLYESLEYEFISHENKAFDKYEEYLLKI